MHTVIASRTAHALGAIVLAAVLIVLSQGAAQAQGSEVRLTGDNANNFFIVRALDASTLEFCTDLVPCFTRARSSVQRIILDGLDGDDGVFIQHGATFVSNPDVPLNLVFVGGAGSDEIRTCAFQACTTLQTTDVSVLPDGDELRIVQCRGRTANGAACVDIPFQQPVPTLKINARGVDVVTDMSMGTLNVVGTPGADTVSFTDGELFVNTAGGATQVTGAVNIDNIATYQFLNKDNLTLDTGEGADTVALKSRAGFASDTTSCARDNAASGAPVCVYAGSETGDRMEVPNAGAGEAVSLATRVSDTARLAGLAIPAVADINGIDELTIPQAQSQLDSFTLYGTPVDDTFAIDLSTPHAATITGALAVNTPVPAPVPTIRLMGDGTGPLAVTVDALGGIDVVTATTGVADDDLTVTPTPGTCFGPAGTCIRTMTGAIDHSRVTVGAERIDLLTGDGSDTLHTVGNLATDLRWTAGAGPDVLDVAGTGSPVTVDLGADTVEENGSAGTITATEVETRNVDVDEGNLTVLGSGAAETLRYTPVDARSATIAIDGDDTTVHGTSIDGTMTIDPLDGDDIVAVDATTTDNSIAIHRGASVTVQVDDTLPVRSSEATEAIELNGRSGDDRFLVNGEGGPSAITVDGGGHTGGDRLSFVAAMSDATISFDAAPASGTMEAGGPAIAFRGLEAVDAEGDEAGTFTVNGSDAGDTIVQDGNTISVGRGTTASFTRYPTLALDGRVGDDVLVLAPRNLTGVSAVHAEGGDAGTDTVFANGTALRETIVYTPDSADSGLLEFSLAPPVTLTGTEVVEVDGRTVAPSGDTLVLDSPAIAGTIVHTPGIAADAGSLHVTGTTGGASSFPTLHYGRLGRGVVVVDGADTAQAAADAFRVIGQSDGDTIELTADGSGGATVVMDSQIPLVTTSIHTIQLHGLDGQDTFRVPTDHGIEGGAGPAIQIDGGASSSGDVAILTGAGGAQTMDLASLTVTETGFRGIAASALGRVDLDAADGGATVLGGTGPDSITVRPTGAAAAIISGDVTSTLVDLARASSLRVDTLDGADSATVLARSIAESITVTRGTIPRVAVGTLLPVDHTDAVEAIRVDAGQGADVVTVEGDGGPASLALDGGSPQSDGDVIRLVAPEATVTFDDPATSGQLSSPGGTLSFAGFDTVDVAGDGSGQLTVRGTDGPDTITLGDPGVPAVRVNDGAAVSYAGYPALTLDGRGGRDTTDISYANLGDLTTIGTAGGIAGDDVVRVIDTLGSARTWTYAPLDDDHSVLSADGGVPVIEATGAASVLLDGRGASDTVQVVSPDGAQDVAITPGGVADSGTVSVGSLVPVSFSDIGLDGLLQINDAAALQLDHVTLTGTDVADTIRVIGTTDEIRLDGFVRIIAQGATALTIQGREGVDTFTATGPFGWDTTTLAGGGPDQGDHVALDSPVGDVVVDINGDAITGFGGTVLVPEISTLETRHDTGVLTLLGTDRDDAMCYDPLTPRDGRMHIIASPGGGLLTDSCQPSPGTLDLTHTFIDVGRLVVDPGAGADQVLVNGTVNDDAVIVESTGEEVAVQVNPSPADTSTVRLAVHMITPTTENVIVANDNGIDDIDVRLYEAAAPVFTIHGEAPDARKGDRLAVRDLSGGANMNDIHGDPQASGTVVTDWKRFSGIEIRVNYTGVENVRLYKGQRPKGSTTSDPVSEPVSEPATEPTNNGGNTPQGTANGHLDVG